MVISQTSISVSPHQFLQPPNPFPIRSHCPTSSCKPSSPSIIDSYCSHRNPVPSLQVTEKCFRPLPASRWVARSQDPRPFAPSWTRDPGLAIIAPLPRPQQLAMDGQVTPAGSSSLGFTCGCWKRLSVDLVLPVAMSTSCPAVEKGCL